MSASSFTFALAHLKSRIKNPRVIAVLAGVAAILAIEGPFETNEVFGFGARLIYWTGVVAATYATGAMSRTFWARELSGRFKSWAKLAAVVSISGASITCVVFVINLLFIETWTDFEQTPLFLGSVFVIASIVVALMEVIMHSAPEPEDQQTPALLDRLPVEKRGALVALTVHNHYVNVITTQGAEMVLMRFSDALKETSPARGLRVHRSHWVAIDHVASVAHRKERAILTLSTGDRMPVSRTYLPALHDAGLT